MKVNRKNQAGFGAIGIVIVVVAVIAIGTTGWLVYRHNHNSPTKVSSTTTTTQNSPQQTTSANTQPAQSAQPVTLDIKEWSVHLTVDNTASTLYYYINSQVPDVAYLSLKSISDVAPTCAANKNSLAAIGRLTEAEQQAITSGATPGTAGTIHIGSYWYSFQNSHADCTNGDAAAQAAIEKAAPNYNVNSLQNTFKTLGAD